ncbi:uncharacterized protein LOC116114004 [Pistacia vera]|uniref:uncharacterized protein LOC116114004 n=1 Tax=Pistacia vera TaxID=55513 RepID=UPI001263E647|nr:uncharacterized protein LOC116114004 [Pistacia vera]
MVSLCAKNKLGFVDGTCTKSSVHDRLAPQWERCNSLVLAWIFNSVSKEIFNGIVYSTNASQVWQDLKEQYHKVNGTRVFGIHREIVNLTQGTNTMAIYFNKLKSLWDELDSMVSLPAPDSASGNTYPEHLNQQKLLQFLMGLNESYSMVRSQILLMNPLPSVKKAYSVVNQDESQRILAGLNTNADVTTRLYAQNDYQFTKGKGNSKSKYSANQVQSQETVAKTTYAKSPNIPTGPVFTSEQYNQILELLGKENSPIAIKPSSKSIIGLPDGTKTHITHDRYSGKLKGIVNGDSEFPNIFLAANVSNSAELWHQRLGHVPYTILRHMQKDFDVSNPPHYTMFGVHIGFQHMEMLETQYHCTPKCIRSDNGLEFFNKECHYLFLSKGIVHQSSCAYSPQQNGVVERKHRHIIAVARALKFQSNIPNNLWGYRVQTAVYLINRFPSSILKGISPFERFFGHPPSLDHINVFGCVAYATILTPKDILSPRSTLCVFLGYSLTQKGYFLYDISSHKVFVTGDALFHETIFPFTWSTSPSSPFPFDPEFLDIELPSTTIAPTVPLSADLLPIVQHAEPIGPPSPSINSSPPQPAIPLRKSSRLTKPPI